MVNAMTSWQHTRGPLKDHDMPSDNPAIDREKVRAHARRMDGVELRIWLNRAIDLLPDQAFGALVGGEQYLRGFLADGGPTPELLSVIKVFHHESLQGQYFEDFKVNSSNCTDLSDGTEIFISEHSRLVDECLRAENEGDYLVAGQGLALLIDLMREIDRCERDIVFFADESGSWQVTVDWLRVLPAWYRCIAPSTDPDTWADLVLSTSKEFAAGDRKSILKEARGIGTPAHQAALAHRESRSRGSA
jgi:hypothetical protein